MHSLFVKIFHRCSLDLQCSIWFFFFWKLIQLYAAVYEVCMQALSILLSWSSSTCPFFIILLLTQCTDSCQNCIHRQYVFGLFFLSFFLSAKLGGLRACRFDATSSHAFCLLLCWATTDCIHYKLFIVFKEMCYWTALHAGHVWFFFSVLEDVLFVGWLQHGIHTSFMASSLFWDKQQKSDRTSHPLVIYSSAFQLCWSAPPSAVIRLQWMRYIPGGSWSAGIPVRGGKKEKRLHC